MQLAQAQTVRKLAEEASTKKHCSYLRYLVIKLFADLAG
jgi:hypothetical protein